MKDKTWYGLTSDVQYKFIHTWTNLQLKVKCEIQICFFLLQKSLMVSYQLPTILLFTLALITSLKSLEVNKLHNLQITLYFGCKYNFCIISPDDYFDFYYHFSCNIFNTLGLLLLLGIFWLLFLRFEIWTSVSFILCINPKKTRGGTPP